MKIFYFALSFSILCALIRLAYKKKFILSLLISLERILLNLLFFKYIYLIFKKTKTSISFTLFILTLSAIEARIGISLLTLVSRDFKKKTIKNTKILKK